MKQINTGILRKIYYKKKKHISFVDKTNEFKYILTTQRHLVI